MKLDAAGAELELLADLLLPGLLPCNRFGDLVGSVGARPITATCFYWNVLQLTRINNFL